MPRGREPFLQRNTSGYANPSHGVVSDLIVHTNFSKQQAHGKPPCRTSWETKGQDCFRACITRTGPVTAGSLLGRIQVRVRLVVVDSAVFSQENRTLAAEVWGQ